MWDECEWKNDKCSFKSANSSSKSGSTTTTTTTTSSSTSSMDSDLFLEGYSCKDTKYFPMFEAAKFIIIIIQIAVPFALIIWGSIDWFKALIAHDEKEMRMKRRPFIARVVAALIIMFLPWLINFISKTIAGRSSSANFWTCYNEAKPRINFSTWKNTPTSTDDSMIGGFNGYVPNTSPGDGNYNGNNYNNNNNNNNNKDDDEPFTPPTGRTQVSTCYGISRDECEDSATETHKCKWDGNCINGDPLDPYRDSCKDFTSPSSCRAGYTSSTNCDWIASNPPGEQCVPTTERTVEYDAETCAELSKDKCDGGTTPTWVCQWNKQYNRCTEKARR